MGVAVPYSLQCVLCACAVGVTVSRQDMSDLKFLYEGHEDFSVLPSYAVIPAMVRSVCV